MDTLLLDVSQWDLVLDINGNIAVASNPYSQAQDAASACRTFSGEVWYDTTQGIDYFGTILGKLPSLQLVKSDLINAVLKGNGAVPGVVAARAFLNAVTAARTLSGQIQIVNKAGQPGVASF